MLQALTKGTKEELIADITDRSAAITDLSASTPQYDIEDSTGAEVHSNIAGTGAGMQLKFIVDLSAAGPGGLLPEGDYQFFFNFSVLGQVVRKGPFEFQIVG
jgi:hypothetical protein